MNTRDLLRRLPPLLKGKLDFHFDNMDFPRKNLGFRKIANFLVGRLEARRHVPAPVSYPFGLQLEPTVNCQLHCPLCARPFAVPDQAEGFMDWTAYQQLMDEIGPYLIGMSLWQWGEPLLHPRITDMIRLASDFGIFTSVSTNAQFKEDEFDVRELVASGLDYLIVCMDGASQENYSKFRVGGEVEILRDFTRRVIGAKREQNSPTPIVDVRILATRDNEHEVDDVHRFAREAGADTSSVKSVKLFYHPELNNPSLPEPDGVAIIPVPG